MTRENPPSQGRKGERKRRGRRRDSRVPESPAQHRQEGARRRGDCSRSRTKQASGTGVSKLVPGAGASALGVPGAPRATFLGAQAVTAGPAGSTGVSPRWPTLAAPLHLLPTFCLADSTPVLRWVLRHPPKNTQGVCGRSRSETPTSLPRPWATPPTEPGTQH